MIFTLKIFFLKLLRLFFRIPGSSYYYLKIINFLNKNNIGNNIILRINFRDSFFLNLRLDDWLQQQIYFFGGYENFELAVLKSKLNLGSNMIDVGANVGLFSLWAASIIGNKGKVIAFEPFTVNYNILKENCELNKFNNISLNKLAISDKLDDIELFYNCKEFNLGMVSAFEQNHEMSEFVKSTTLDSFLENYDLSTIDFIKLDIEGGEYLALQGMKMTIEKYKPFIQIEIDDNILIHTANSKADFFLFFESVNYIMVSPEIANIKRNKSSKNYFFQAKG